MIPGIRDIQAGNFKAIARAISCIENQTAGYLNLLQQLPESDKKIIGITGPPGAGKSTLTDGVIQQLIEQNKKVAVFCIDPASPFNRGAVLGDRVRMQRWYTHPHVYIRSLSNKTRPGGLHPQIIEITDLAKAAPFDYIIVETVGVGQAEIEIAGLADLTLVVLVPEAGDDIQTMKAGLMEIADVFVVNKFDRPDAQLFVKHLNQMLAPVFARRHEEVPIAKTIAATGSGILELVQTIQQQLQQNKPNELKSYLLAEKAWQLIQAHRMRGIDIKKLQEHIEADIQKGDFNLYRLVAAF